MTPWSNCRQMRRNYCPSTWMSTGGYRSRMMIGPIEVDYHAAKPRKRQSNKETPSRRESMTVAALLSSRRLPRSRRESCWRAYPSPFPPITVNQIRKACKAAVPPVLPQTWFQVVAFWDVYYNRHLHWGPLYECHG